MIYMKYHRYISSLKLQFVRRVLNCYAHLITFSNTHVIISLSWKKYTFFLTVRTFEKFFCPKVDGFISLSNNIMCKTRLLECAKAKSSPDINLIKNIIQSSQSKLMKDRHNYWAKTVHIKNIWEHFECRIWSICSHLPLKSIKMFNLKPF